jgi:hypothetical protein
MTFGIIGRNMGKSNGKAGFIVGHMFQAFSANTTK